jgi:hypothetical protein
LPISMMESASSWLAATAVATMRSEREPSGFEGRQSRLADGAELISIKETLVGRWSSKLCYCENKVDTCHATYRKRERPLRSRP